MSYKHLHAFLAIVMATCMLTSCRSDLKLSDVDTRMDAHLDMALPVGTVKMNFGNLMKLDQNTSMTIDTIGNQGVLSFNITPDPDTTRHFSIFDFSQKIKAGTNFEVDMYKQLQTATYPFFNPLTQQWEQVSLLKLADQAELMGLDTIVLPEGCSFDSTVVFNLALPLSNINRPGLHERVDSISFSETNFSVTISKSEFDGINPEWIDSIVMDLNKQEFDLHGGSNQVVLHSPSTSPIVFDQPINFQLDKLTMKFTKDESLTPSFTNVYDTVWLSARIKYHVPSGTKVTFKKTAKLNCQFNVGKLEPIFIWGWFTPYKDMYDAGKFPLNINFDELPFLKDPNTVLPFYRPELEARVRTRIAGVIQMEGDTLSAFDRNNVEHFAIFNPKAESDSLKIRFYHTFPISECIDPSSMSTINDTTNLSIKFSRDFGQIHNLFEGGIPKEVKYKFLFSFDSVQTPQIRIPMNTFVHLYSKAKLPFSFQKGFYLRYEDIAQNIDISQFNIDSLLGKNITVSDTSQLGVIMTTESSVPLHVKLILRCLDNRDSVIMDPENPSQEFKIFDTDTLDIYPPVVTQTTTAQGKNWTFRPNKQVNNAHLTKRQLKEVFPNTKSLRYTLIIDDTALKESYDAGLDEVPIGKDGTIKFIIGLTAQMDVAINLNQNKK